MYKHLLERQMRVYWLIILFFFFFKFYGIGTFFLFFAFTAQHDEETLEEEAEYDDDALMSYSSFDYYQNLHYQDLYLLKHSVYYKKRNGNKIRI